MTFKMAELKKACNDMADSLGITMQDAARLIGYYNSGPAYDADIVRDIINGDYTAATPAAAALGITIKDRSRKKSQNKKSKASKAATLSADNTAEKTPGKKTVKKSAVKDHTKDSKAKQASLKRSAADSATLTRSAALPAVDSDTIPTIDGDIISPDILPDSIPALIKDTLAAWCDETGIDLYKARQNQWSAACQYIGFTIFKPNKHILADKPPARGGFQYNLDKLYSLVDIWLYYCRQYTKVPLIHDYCDFIGVDPSTVHVSGGNYTAADKATPARVRLLKKLHDIQESGLAGAIVDGRQNPTGALAALNHWHGWTKTTEVIHTTAAAGPSAPALPVFDTDQGGLIEDNGGSGD